MRWLCGLALALACGCSCGELPAIASSTFEANDEGWVLGGDPTDTRPELRGTGGNPGGHICGKDAVQSDIWYFIAPAQYLGNATAAFGRRITWDLKQDTIYQQLKGRDLILQGGGLSIVFNIRETPAKEWTPYQAVIDDTSGWKLDDGTMANATAEQMKTVLKSVTSFRIRGEFADGPDSACLDNVAFGVR